MTKCPPGIICIENYTFLLLAIVICVVLFFIYKGQTHSLGQTQTQTNNHSFEEINTNISMQPLPGSSYTTIQNDILLNPYSAPVRDDRYFTNDALFRGPRIPINVPTQSFDTAYRQIGILTRANGNGSNDSTILPLMGRPLFSNRDKWNFYTMNDKNPMIKLPIKFRNRSCSSDQGCDNVYNGDTVYVEGYSDIFKVTVYENNTLSYIPYL